MRAILRFRLGARVRVLLVLLSIAAGGIGDVVHAQDRSTPTKIARRKALFIEQFTRLIEWPPAVLAQDGPFVLCLEGASDTATELSNIAAVRKFKDRPTEIRRLRPGASAEGCHVLYIAGSEAARVGQILGAIADSPILTVSDTPGFGARGVHFNLFEETRSAPREGTYVGFELNVSTVKRSVLLLFSPQLLKEGRRVETAAAGNNGRPSPP